MFVFSNLFKVMEIYEIYTKKESFFVPHGDDFKVYVTLT